MSEIPVSGPILLPLDERPIGDVIAPFTKDGYFIEDFWMMDRVGAQTGASVREYEQAHTILSYTGFENLHSHVLGPDLPNHYWNETMVSSGDLHWNPRWDSYYWNPDMNDQQNLANWEYCGRPHQNKYGVWVKNGVTPEMYEWQTMRASERPIGPPPWKKQKKHRRWY